MNKIFLITATFFTILFITQLPDLKERSFDLMEEEQSREYSFYYNQFN